MQTIESEKRAGTTVRRFPMTDYNYHSTRLEGFSGPCARIESPAFHEISSEYFKGEACNYFLAEAAVFALILATAVLPLFNGAHAVVDLVRTIGGV